MKEELQKQLVDKSVQILDSIQQAASSASNFAVEQLPDIAQQCILYGRINESVTQGVVLLALLISTYYLVIGFKKQDEFLMAFFGIMSPLSGLVFMLNLSSFLLVWVAPKVWLIKEMSRLIR